MMAIAMSLPKVCDRFVTSCETALASKSALNLSGRLRSSRSMRALFSAVALGNIMRVMVANDALATVGQCSGSSGWASGSELNSLS